MLTATVVIVNVPEFCPDRIVTEDGTFAADPEAEIGTEIPLDPAGAFKVTVPVTVTPPATVVGLTLTDTNVGGEYVTFNVAVALTPPELAVIVTAVLLVTAMVASVNVAFV